MFSGLEYIPFEQGYPTCAPEHLTPVYYLRVRYSYRGSSGEEHIPGVGHEVIVPPSLGGEMRPHAREFGKVTDWFLRHGMAGAEWVALGWATRWV